MCKNDLISLVLETKSELRSLSDTFTVCFLIWFGLVSTQLGPLVVIIVAVVFGLFVCLFVVVVVVRSYRPSLL